MGVSAAEMEKVRSDYVKKLLDPAASTTVFVCPPNSLEDVTALLDERQIAKYKWPERLQIVDAMPLTPTRKIMRGKLKQLLTDTST